MSALDQAFIKAYAKDQPALGAMGGAAVASRPTPTAPRTAQGSAVQGPAAQAGLSKAQAGTIEQLYRDGTLYRVEVPAAAPPTARAIPQPHVKLLPPTSPRRGVQRSLLRLLANQPPESAPEASETPPRVARKVIIRHISHSATPAPLGLLRAASAPEPDPEILPSPSALELPPETIDEPSTEPTAPAAQPVPTAQPIPTIPAAAPPTAPLNQGAASAPLSAEPPIAIHAEWDHHAGLVLLAEPAEFLDAGPDGMVAVQLEALDLPAPPPAPAAADEEHAFREEVATRFAGKSLDDRDNSKPTFRVDSSHARAVPQAHAKFAATAAEADVEEAPQTAATPAPSAAPQQVELTLAEPGPATEAEATEAATATRSTADAASEAKARRMLPLWEVDRFHWPKTCDKLLSAEGSYFAQAGDKLVAAVRDGLRVLAITGSRRGEGRTTLALCLARVAAQAGLQTAVMDADFARPQLASKIGLEIAHGWQDAALGKVPLSEAAVKSLADNVTALPLESSSAGTRLSLADPRVTATVRAAAATFELLILDLGPIGPGEELAFPLGERCPLDAAIVVRDLRFATLAESEAIGHALSDAGIEAVGIAENFVMEDELPQTSV
jgi:Mrp family chromosome partitioning ATPase